MRRFIIYVVVSLCTCVSCHPDFDEVKDTDQRYITFTFNTDELYSKVIDNNGVYLTDEGLEISSDYRIRITAYCYDMEDSLLFTDMFLSSQYDLKDIKIRHLHKDEAYRFVFLADIVKHDAYVNYYETWYQLGVRNWSDFYIYADFRYDDAINNVLGLCTFIQQAENQVIDVDISSISYNGYIIFDNLHKVDRLDGYVLYCSSFNLKFMEWERLSSMAYEFDYYNEEVERIIKPVSLNIADSLILAQIRRITLKGNDTLDVRVYNKKRQPFILTIDCDNLKMVDCKFY